jgi:hypothetical protein
MVDLARQAIGSWRHLAEQDNSTDEASRPEFALAQ